MSQTATALRPTLFPLTPAGLPRETRNPCRGERRCLAREALARLARRIVLDTLRPMQRGYLRLELPDGTVTEFGQPSPFARRKLPLGINRIARLQVRSDRFFTRCVLSGDIGFAESYLAGEWDSPDVTAVIAWFLLNHENAPTVSGTKRRGPGVWAINLLRLANRWGHLARANTRSRARENISAHYDLSNRFFQLMLDPSMMYSAARFTDRDQSLEQAQFEKNEALCRSLQLRPSHRVLEIGTGWGGWALHAARRYGCRITTVTLSEEQRRFAEERIRLAGLGNKVEVRLMDYREVTGQFDRIVSIEMLEAVGHAYLPAFTAVVDRVLKPEGLIALQFITCPDHRYEAFRSGVDFIQKHIFPGSLLLSLNRVNEHLSRAGGFVLHGVTDLGHDYALTLRHWLRNLAANRGQLEELGFDEAFHRKWSYYLMYCEAAFAMRNISAVQTVHTRANNLSLQG